MARSKRALINSANSSRQAKAICFWTEPRVALLCELWARDEYALDIAASLGGGCTRAMVIGKANRLKLKRRKGWGRFGNERKGSHIRVSRETISVSA